MKKFLTTALFLILAALILAGCGNKVTRQHHDRMMKVAVYDDCTIYVDTETGTEYIRFQDAHSGLAPVLDYNGYPVQWEAFDAREDRYPAKEASSP